MCEGGNARPARSASRTPHEGELRYESRMRRLSPAELPAASDTLAHAFYDDPVFVFLLPDPSLRLAWVRVVMGGLLAMSAPDGHLYADGEAGVAGALSLTPPGKYPHPMRRLVGYVVRGTWLQAGRPSMRVLRGIVRLLGVMDKMHVQGPHWYVHVLGVHPANQGKGVGARLLRGGLDLADRDGLPSYLETSNPKNLAFYQRFGFVTLEEVRPEGGYPPLWSMRRPANAKA